MKSELKFIESLTEVEKVQGVDNRDDLYSDYRYCIELIFPELRNN